MLSLKQQQAYTEAGKFIGRNLALVSGQVLELFPMGFDGRNPNFTPTGIVNGNQIEIALVPCDKITAIVNEQPAIKRTVLIIIRTLNNNKLNATSSNSIRYIYFNDPVKHHEGLSDRYSVSHGELHYNMLTDDAVFANVVWWKDIDNFSTISFNLSIQDTNEALALTRTGVMLSSCTLQQICAMLGIPDSQCVLEQISTYDGSSSVSFTFSISWYETM